MPLTQVRTEDLINYESGLLSFKEEVDFFQALIDTGMAWTLQGRYGRNAQRLIEIGVCYPRKEAKP